LLLDKYLGIRNLPVQPIAEHLAGIARRGRDNRELPCGQVGAGTHALPLPPSSVAPSGCGPDPAWCVRYVLLRNAGRPQAL